MFIKHILLVYVICWPPGYSLHSHWGCHLDHSFLLPECLLLSWIILMSLRKNSPIFYHNHRNIFNSRGPELHSSPLAFYHISSWTLSGTKTSPRFRNQKFCSSALWPHLAFLLSFWNHFPYTCPSTLQSP